MRGRLKTTTAINIGWMLRAFSRTSLILTSCTQRLRFAMGCVADTISQRESTPVQSGSLNTLMINLVLVVSFFLILYVYLVYFLLLAGLGSLRRRREVPPAVKLPVVTLVIPAHNEGSVIRAKLENSLAIAYLRDLLEIIVASDGSDDGTEEIVKEFAHLGVVLQAYRPRHGKTSVLNRAIPQAQGSIVVLCDANVMFDPEAVNRMVRHFADPRVGAVTGDVQIRSEDAPFGEGKGLYYRYERFIQLMESALGSTVTVDGGMYAIRKHLFVPLPENTILDDFVIGMKIAKSGHRVVYDPSALASENATIDVRQEFDARSGSSPVQPGSCTVGASSRALDKFNCSGPSYHTSSYAGLSPGFCWQFLCAV